MDETTLYACIPDKQYPIFWFKEPYSLLDAMFCRLYGFPNYSHFRTKWASISHHIISTGKSFNWAQILSVVLRYFISQAQKTKSSKKPKFYLSAYVSDIIFSSFAFPTMNWKWTKQSPPVHIYCSALWEDNYIPLIYESSWQNIRQNFTIFYN